MLRRALLASPLLLILLAGCGSSGRATTTSTHRATAAPLASTGVPVLLPETGRPPEADDPPALRAFMTTRAREGLRLTQEAGTAPRTRDGGCVHERPTTASVRQTAPAQWLPRRPRVAATMLGHQVEVDVTLPARAPSAACRVIGLTAVVFSGGWGTTSYDATGGIQEYSLFGREQLAGRRVRLAVQIPWGGTPPYRLSVNTATATGLSSAYVQLPLRCPKPGRCISGWKPNQPGLPAPHLATRGVTAASLARSLRQVVAGDSGWVKPTAVQCENTKACVAEFRDPVVNATVQVRYAVEGEQRRGCWLAVGASRITPPDAKVIGPAAAGLIGGCVGWVS